MCMWCVQPFNVLFRTLKCVCGESVCVWCVWWMWMYVGCVLGGCVYVVNVCVFGDCVCVVSVCVWMFGECVCMMFGG